MRRFGSTLLLLMAVVSLASAQPTTGPGVSVVRSDTEPTSCRPGDIWIDTSSGVPADYTVNVAADCTTGAIVYVSAGAVGAGGGEAIAIADLPATATHGSTRTVNDGVDANDCTVGEGTHVHDCAWDTTEEVWSVKIQGSLQAQLEQGDYPGFNALTTGTPLILAPNGDSDVREVIDNFGSTFRRRRLTGGALGTGTLLPVLDSLFLPLDSEWTASYDNGTSEIQITRLTTSILGALTVEGALKPGYDLVNDSPAQGEVPYYNGTAWKNLPVGTAGQVYRTNGAGQNPSWVSRSWMACVEVVNADATMDNVLFPFVMPEAGTVTHTTCKVLSGTVVQAPTFTLADDDSNSMTITGTNPTCAAVGTDATWAAVTAGGGLVEGEAIKYSISNTPDANDTFALCIRGSFP